MAATVTGPHPNMPATEASPVKATAVVFVVFPPILPLSTGYGGIEPVETEPVVEGC